MPSASGATHVYPFSLFGWWMHMLDGSQPVRSLRVKVGEKRSQWVLQDQTGAATVRPPVPTLLSVAHVTA